MAAKRVTRTPSILNHSNSIVTLGSTSTSFLLPSPITYDYNGFEVDAHILEKYNKLVNKLVFLGV